MNIKGERNPWDTPCVGVCSASNLGDKVCRGCGRTQEEIDNWNTYTPEQKIEINQRARDRHENLSG